MFRDLITTSLGNLWRMKLRTFLTVSGVVIAIAAFVSMLSFGAGMQENISNEFNELGLFSTMIVYPADEEMDTLDVEPPILNEAAISLISEIPGVIYAYPYNDFSVSIDFQGIKKETSAQALPERALGSKLFTRLSAGDGAMGDTLKTVLVTEEFLELFELESPDSVIGKQVIISAMASSIDSGLINIIKNEEWDIGQRIRQIEFDSLFDSDYRKKIIGQEINGAVKRFLDGYLEARIEYSDTLVISGVLKGNRRGHLRTKPIIIPIGIAKWFKENNAGMDQTDLLAAFQNGTLFFQTSSNSLNGYSQITLEIDQNVLHKNISDSVKSIGFRTFSYAEKFEEIQKFFMYFDMGLGLIGLIALITASLGIVNTMVMSISERKREIGVLKSLGADENYIRLLFLSESAVIGSIGAILGIIFGWLISRFASFVAKSFMEKEGVDVVELFSMPFWLILAAFSLGVTVSLIAGYLPSSKAAMVDPVEALRND